jgi:predicted ArsR family transcriptional regulator
MCRGSGVSERELRSGSQRRRVSEVRTEIACYLSREMGISMAEMARRLRVGTSAIAMAIRRRNADGQKL